VRTPERTKLISAWIALVGAWLLLIFAGPSIAAYLGTRVYVAMLLATGCLFLLAQFAVIMYRRRRAQSAFGRSIDLVLLILMALGVFLVLGGGIWRLFLR
jgi:hypothetical protein